MATGIDLGKYKLGWHDNTSDYVNTPKKGVNEEVVRDISHQKSEPEWMTKFRLNALKRFERKPMLEWFARNMPDIDFNDIFYYIKPTEKQVSDWDMLPEAMKATYEKLGIPEAERKFLAGVTAQYESEVVYHKNRADLEEWASSSPTWTPPSGSGRTWSSRTSGRSSRPTTTSSRR